MGFRNKTHEWVFMGFPAIVLNTAWQQLVRFLLEEKLHQEARGDRRRAVSGRTMAYRAMAEIMEKEKRVHASASPLPHARESQCFGKQGSQIMCKKSPRKKS